MPKCYQLVGVPGSGKSTWARVQDWFDDCVYVSTDKFVDAEAERQGKTYIEVFDNYMPRAVELMSAEIIIAREKELDIIWDQTSTTITSRMRKFNMLPTYEHIAIVFQTPEPAELKRRLKSRPGKVIPKRVIDSMIEHWETPTLEEGFTEIWYAQ